MTRNPEGAPRQVRKEPGTIRKAFRSVRRAGPRTLAAGLAATGVGETILAPSAVASEKTTTIVRSTSASPSIIERYPNAQIPQSVVDALQAKEKKDKGDSEQAEGKTKAETKAKNKTKEQAPTLKEQISAVAESVDATLRMTPEEFKAWAEEKSPTDRGNSIALSPTIDMYIPFDFPLGGGSGEGPDGRPLNAPSITFSQDLTQTFYGTCLPCVYDYSKPYPHVEHLSLVNFNTETQTWSTLALYNGSITIPLPNEENGFTTISVATSVWPDGTKIPYLFVSNFNLPNNPALGENQSVFSDKPAVGQTEDRNSLHGRDTSSVSREELFKRLGENIGKPIYISFASEGLLQDLDVNGLPIDVRIPGKNAFQPYSTFDALRQAYFAQTPDVFQATVQQGQADGIFLSNNSVGSKKIRQEIKALLPNLTNLDDTLARLPFGFITTFSDATSPFVDTVTSVAKK